MQKRILPLTPLSVLSFFITVLFLLPGSPIKVQAQAPANDNCVNAITLTSSTLLTTGTTVNATESLPAIYCSGSEGNADDDVWYKFIATANSHTVIVMGDGLFDAVIDVRSGACNGVNIACADIYQDGGTETVYLSGLTIGNTYYVRVYSYWEAELDSGTFKIGVFPPPNDDCANAITLTSATTFSGVKCSTVTATQSLAAINCNGTGTADDDVWYKFTAASTVQVVTVIGEGDFDAVIDVRSGACNGVNIGCASATSSGGTESVRLTGLTIGNIYYIRVYSAGGLSYDRGTFTIGVTHVFPPANDDCANAISLTSAINFSGTAGTTVNATFSMAGINCNGQNDFPGAADDDVWYKFTAVSTTHFVTVAAVGGFNQMVDVRSGACNGTNIACATQIFMSNLAKVRLSGLTIGNTYYIRIYSWGDEEQDFGSFTIGVTHLNDECADAFTLTSATSFSGVAGTTVDATNSQPAISCNEITGNADDDVWYKFTAITNSHIVKVIGGTGFDTVIDIRSGACNGTTIGCADATGADGIETVSLTGLTIGNIYYIRVYSAGALEDDRGAFTIGVTHEGCPATLLVTGPITSGMVVMKAVRITATNQVSGAVATYQGSQSVTLQPGFSAVIAEGKTFQAVIGGCP